jgi:hypothetical protein
MAVIAHTQKDIVDQFLAREKKSKISVEKLRIPDIEKHFFGPAPGITIKTDNVRFPGLSGLGIKSRAEIADTLVSLSSYRSGVVGFDWDIEHSELKIMYVDGMMQRVFQTDPERQQVVDMLKNALKARPFLLQVKWEFGKEYLEVHYLSP